MSKDEGPGRDDPRSEIEVRLGGLLGDLGAALGDALSRLEAGAEGEVRRERTFDTGRGPVRASAGVQIRPLGAAAAARAPSGRRPDRPLDPGRPDATAGVATPPDPAPPRDAPPVEPRPRAIEATILEDPTTWRLVAELPGVAPEDIALADAGGELTITASGRGRLHEGRFALPAGATVSDLELSARNGIVEIAWRRPGGAA